MLCFQIVKRSSFKHTIGAEYIKDCCRICFDMMISFVLGRMVLLKMNIHKILFCQLPFTDYSHINGLFSSAKTSTHGLSKFENKIRSPVSRSVASVLSLSAYLVLHYIMLPLWIPLTKDC